MEQITSDFFKTYFSKPDTVEYYTNAIDNIKLWESEKDIFLKYLHNSDTILDIGCGTGRVAFSLYNLGYKHIVGIDFSNRMIQAAKLYAKQNNIKINFITRDILKVNYTSVFNATIFSFNGLILIPGKSNRYKAVRNINRALKDNGIFIFTTHNARYTNEYVNWESEKQAWSSLKQDKKIIDYGDIIFTTNDGDLYFHFPTDEEIIEMLNKCGFAVIDYFIVSDRYKERQDVVDFMDDCKFWIAQKKISI